MQYISMTWKKNSNLMDLEFDSKPVHGNIDK